MIMNRINYTKNKIQKVNDAWSPIYYQTPTKKKKRKKM